MKARNSDYRPRLPKKQKIQNSLLTNQHSVAIIQKLSGTATEYGGIAQLGERLNGIQEVSGSIPLISTKNLRNLRISEVFLYFSELFTPFSYLLKMHKKGKLHLEICKTEFQRKHDGHKKHNVHNET